MIAYNGQESRREWMIKTFERISFGTAARILKVR